MEILEKQQERSRSRERGEDRARRREQPFALWPAMWADPFGVATKVVGFVLREGGRPHNWSNYFLGEHVTDDPGPLFYPVALLFRLSPFVLGGVAVYTPSSQGAAEIVGDSCTRRWQRDTFDGETFPVDEGGDPVAFMRQHHARIPYLHVKSVDREVQRRVEDRRGVRLAPDLELGERFFIVDNAAPEIQVDVHAQLDNPNVTGTIGEWFAHLLNIATGRVDRPGGRRYERGYVDTVKVFDLLAKPLEGTSRVRGLPAVAGHHALAVEGAVFAGVSEPDNRVLIGVEDLALASTIRDLAVARGVPAEALAFEKAEPVVALQTLQSKVDPIVGGLQINFPGFLCTFGFNALHGAGESWITNSHCTDNQGQMTGTLYRQPLTSVDPTVMGVEVGTARLWKRADAGGDVHRRARRRVLRRVLEQTSHGRCRQPGIQPHGPIRSNVDLEPVPVKSVLHLFARRRGELGRVPQRREVRLGLGAPRGLDQVLVELIGELGDHPLHLLGQHQVRQAVAAHEPGAGVGGLVPSHVGVHRPARAAAQGLGDEVGGDGTAVLGGRQCRGVVLGELSQVAALQAVGAGVTHVEPEVAVAVEQDPRDRGPHAGELGVLERVVLDLLVDVAEELGDLLRAVEARPHLGHPVHRVLGGDLSRGLAADSVRDREDDRFAHRQHAADRGGHVRAGDGESTHDHGVLVGGADSAPVREGRDNDFPTSDTHTPFLPFHRPYGRLAGVWRRALVESRTTSGFCNRTEPLPESVKIRVHHGGKHPDMQFPHRFSPPKVLQRFSLGRALRRRPVPV